MNKIEEVRKALLVAKESIEKNIEELNRLDEEEEEPVTLRVAYETERDDIITIPQTSLYSVKKWKVTPRGEGLLAGKAFRLNDEFDWEIGKDEKNVLCLVPIKKDEIKDIIGHFEPR